MVQRAGSRLGPVQLQVAELVKIAMVIMIAAFVAKHANQVQRFKNMAVYLWIFFTIIPAGMVMFISNNLSSALIILGIGFMLSFVFTNQEETAWYHCRDWSDRHFCRKKTSC